MLTIDAKRLIAATPLARVEHHAVLGSTNDRARELAAGDPGPLPVVVVADEQTAGRGRGKNRWWTGSGNLAFSLLLDAESLGIERARSPLVGLAAAIAVCQVVEGYMFGHVAGIHWPNDVFIASGKLAGVLVEVPSARHIVIGIGVNTNSRLSDAPADLRGKIITLADLSAKQQDHTELLLAVVDRLFGLLRHLPESPATIGEMADRLCLQHGRQLSLETPTGTVSGRCLGIARDGALVLETASGRQLFYSGVLR